MPFASETTILDTSTELELENARDEEAMVRGIDLGRYEIVPVHTAEPDEDADGDRQHQHAERNSPRDGIVRTGASDDVTSSVPSSNMPACRVVAAARRTRGRQGRARRRESVARLKGSPTRSRTSAMTNTTARENAGIAAHVASDRNRSRSSEATAAPGTTSTAALPVQARSIYGISSTPCVFARAPCSQRSCSNPVVMSAGGSAWELRGDDTP